MLARARERFGIGRRRLVVRQRVLLRVAERGHQIEIAGERVALRQRAKALCAVGEYARAIGQAYARNRTRRERFDLAAFENALGHGQPACRLP